VTEEFWMGVLAGSLTTFGLTLLWGFYRVEKRRTRTICRWCGGSRDVPVVVKGEACPSPFHAGHPDWDF
jgi:hypothetical protein